MKKLTNVQTTQAAYTIEAKTQRRVTGFENGQAVWTEYTQYDILRDGQMIRFVFNEEDILPMIDLHEKLEANPTLNNAYTGRFD